MTEKIRILLIKKNITITELADKLGCTSQNISAKFKRDNFSEHDLKKIADVLNCDLEINFKDRDSGEIII